MDGILNIDKPAGITSHGVVARVKKLSGERKVGHAGTLDPAATGVLPVCLGRATRIVEYLMDTSKVYLTEIMLGLTTDTYDTTGQILDEKPVTGISLGTLEKALETFVGVIEQLPPMFSAVKHQGQPLYRMARSGIAVERKSRIAHIYRLELLDWQPPLLTIEMECGKGTYVRTLAHDLGTLFGCGGVVNSLRRLRCGFFDIRQAVPLDTLTEATDDGNLASYVQPADSAIRHIPWVEIDEKSETAMRQGKRLDLAAVKPGDLGAPADYINQLNHLYRAYNKQQQFIGMLVFNPINEQFRPAKVFIQ
ncbi:tRNA pseudouridine(55) synthase TruB [Chloroflexota bacterium]